MNTKESVAPTITGCVEDYMQIELTEKEAEVVSRCLDGTEFILERVLETTREEVFKLKCVVRQKICDAKVKEKKAG